MRAVTGTISRAQALPIAPIPGIPGGTIANPVAIPGTRSWSGSPAHSGTGAVVSRGTVLAMTAISGRGAGPAGSRASEAMVHAGVRMAGVRSNHPMVGALVNADIRNPAVAPYVLLAKMRPGATRIR